MTLDITKAIAAVDREVSTRQHQGRLARVIVATRTYPTSRDDLWDALTNPERVPRWFLPISGDLHVGGRYQFEGSTGGEITACDPPRHLAVTWIMHGADSWVTVELAEDGTGSTTLRLEHVAHVPDDFWEEFGPGAVGVGWDQALLGLDEYLSGVATFSPETAAEWLSSNDGKEFVRASSDSWGRASMEAGTSTDAARGAAERTRAFYTGES